MSFDVFLQHFSAGKEATVDPAPVAKILAREKHSRLDGLGSYRIEFSDGVDVRFGADGLDGKEPIGACSFHLHGIGLPLFQFMLDVAKAGDFVIFNAQGENTAESPVLILVHEAQAADVPEPVLKEYEYRPVCDSAERLGEFLVPDFGDWQEYRNQVVGGT